MKMVWAFAVLLATLLIVDRSMAEQLRLGENLRHEQIGLSPSIPDRSRMILVDTSTVFLHDRGTAGILMFYDDGHTKREVDYIEFYDLQGNLLLISWIDRLGVCQVAMDRGLLDVDEPEVDGTLVLIGVGREL